MNGSSKSVWLGALGGAAIIPILVVIWVWEHHMFIVGVSSPFGAFVALLIPLAPVLAGGAVLFKALRNRAD